MAFQKSKQLLEDRSQCKSGLGLGSCEVPAFSGLGSAEKSTVYHMHPVRVGHGHGKDLAVAPYCSGCGQNVSLLLTKGSWFSHIHASSELMRFAASQKPSGQGL